MTYLFVFLGGAGCGVVFIELCAIYHEVRLEAQQRMDGSRMADRYWREVAVREMRRGMREAFHDDGNV